MKTGCRPIRRDLSEMYKILNEKESVDKATFVQLALDILTDYENIHRNLLSQDAERQLGR